MQNLNLKQLSIQEDTIIDQNYQESIAVPKNKTLIIKGQTNRLINVHGGTVIIEGTANRINGFEGNIIIQKNGFVDSLYCGGNIKINIFGSIHESYLLKGATLTMEKTGMAIQIANDNSNVTIKEDSYIKNYNQWGGKANCNIIGNGDHIIQNMNIKCGGKNE